MPALPLPKGQGYEDKTITIQDVFFKTFLKFFPERPRDTANENST